MRQSQPPRVRKDFPLLKHLGFRLLARVFRPSQLVLCSLFDPVHRLSFPPWCFALADLTVSTWRGGVRVRGEADGGGPQGACRGNGREKYSVVYVLTAVRTIGVPLIRRCGQ